MDMTVLIALIGILSNVISAWAGWFFGRKKQNAEVAMMQLEYIKSSDAFYKEKINDLTEENRRISIELHQLKAVVDAMIDDACLVKGCSKRQYYSPDRISEILRGHIEDENEYTDKENKPSA